MRVLLVDDSTTTAKQLAQIIKEIPGYEVVATANNGAEAVRLYHQLKPDVVCMDIVMPIMDGLQATRAILQMEKDAKIVVISSVGGVAEKAVEALKFGARSVISKPFHPDEVRQALDALKSPLN